MYKMKTIDNQSILRHKPRFSQNIRHHALKVSFSIMMILLSVAMQARVFRHPGILTVDESIQRMKSDVAAQRYPAYGSFVKLKNHHCSRPDYEPFGPFPVISRDGEYGHTKSKMEQDFSAAYQNSILWALTGEKAHSDKALEILLGYARTLKTISDTNDAPLLAGIEGWKIAYATEMLRHTDSGMTDIQFDEICGMLKNIFLPVMNTFYDTKAYTNGNWGAIVTKAYMASAILLDDEGMYDKAVDFYLNANDNGTIANYISAQTGQIQESGRDQAHCMLGIGAMAVVCEMAWQQGDDLYGALDNRLMKGFEYVAKYNLGEEVPFTQWTDITGKYSDWEKVSPYGRGRFKPVFEIPYNHYNVRKGLRMPYTERVLEITRPEGYDRDEAAFGSLLFYEGAPESAKVHAYTPYTVPSAGLAGPYPFNVRSDRVSSRYEVKVEDTQIMPVKFDSSDFGDQGYNVDVARFASNLVSPVVTIILKDGVEIEDVTIHPACFYDSQAISIDKDKRTVKFTMDDRLPYAILAINGGDPQDAYPDNPHLVIINDPLEHRGLKPSPIDSNVLDFRSFAEDYLKSHPIADHIGDICRPAASVTDCSLNNGIEYTWKYDDGRFVSYDEKRVAFPDKRARNANDLSDALQAALMKIRDTPELNTLYIGPGVYLWSGLRIFDWNGDIDTGGKPLYVYTDEDALMVNRMKECRESLEPAVFIKGSNGVTISGRGMHDAQGCLTLLMDRKDARNTPHQGGVVVMHSTNITFNDTYMRDSQQWNWETHNSRNITYNNIKGLSPYNHGWIDGLNFSSGKNITVNKSLTLGNDDTFATGHYNPSDEFPCRTYNENPGINLEDTDDNPAELRHTFAAAAIYNSDRLNWSTDDSEDIKVNDAMGWTRTAHCIRAGSNLGAGKPWIGETGYSLKSYSFRNFHSIAGRKAGGMIRFQNGNYPSWPSFDNIVIEDCSFWTPASTWLLLEGEDSENHPIKNVALRNVVFVKPFTNPTPAVSGVQNLTIENMVVDGKRVSTSDSIGLARTLDKVSCFNNDFE